MSYTYWGVSPPNVAFDGHLFEQSSILNKHTGNGMLCFDVLDPLWQVV